MGAAQSSGSSAGLTSNLVPHITVVRSDSNASDTSIQPVTLPPRTGPILTLEGSRIDKSKHPAKFQLDAHIWLDFLERIDTYVRKQDDNVVSRQKKLEQKIVSADDQVQKFSNSYINDKHRTLATMKSEFKKLKKLEESVDKSRIQAEICIDMLNKLNFLLPEEDKLEPITRDEPIESSDKAD